MVWTSCEGETAADEENLGGVSYTPWQGFPGFYYPYLNQLHYLSPIVMIQFRNLTPGVIIQIRQVLDKVKKDNPVQDCTIYVKTIKN